MLTPHFHPRTLSEPLLYIAPFAMALRGSGGGGYVPALSAQALARIAHIQLPEINLTFCCICNSSYFVLRTYLQNLRIKREQGASIAANPVKRVCKAPARPTVRSGVFSVR